MKRWPGSTSPEHVIMGYNGGVLSLSPTPLNRETVPGEYCEHLRTSTNIYEHSDAQVDLYSYAMILLSAAPNYGHVRSCQSMRGTALQWAWLSDCQGALPRNPLRGLAKWIKMDQNGSKWIKMDQNGSKWLKMDQNGSKWIKMDQHGYWHLDMVQMVQICLDIF